MLGRKFDRPPSVPTLPNSCGFAASDRNGCSAIVRTRRSTMERKGGSSTAVVTKESVKASLSKVRTLDQTEEKVVRMRHGASVDPKAPLPRAAGDNEELGDELLLIEMQLMRAWKARLSQTKGNALSGRIEPAPSAAKNKIV